MNRVSTKLIRRLICVLVVILIGTSFAQTAITNSVFSTAGGTAQSSSFSLTGTAGQITETGRAGTQRFTLSGGIIYNLVNNPPAVANRILDQSLPVGGSVWRHDLNASPFVFNDPDNDALSYTARSNATAIATTHISGSMLAVAPVAVGNATIMVIADDGRGGMDSTSFAVMVGTIINRPPIIPNPIPDQTLVIGDDPVTIDLDAAPAVFNDPDGDVLTYTASSSAVNVATATISGSTLTLAPVSAGEAAILLSANDNRGGTAADTFSVTVIRVNQRPMVAREIPDTTLALGGPSFQLDLSAPPAVFNDANGDALTYRASSNATAVATAEVSGGLLVVVPVATGVAEITVTADDGELQDSTEFQVTVIDITNRAPNIIHTAIGLRPAGQFILVQANITDDAGVAAATLHYRRGGDIDFASVPMTANGGVFQATIPAAGATARGTEYFITAVDQANLAARLPMAGIFSIPIQFSVEAKPTALPGGSERTSYRLVSVPFQLNEATAIAVLEDDLGPYASSAWRLFGLVAGQPLTNKSPYAEMSATGAFLPGQSLFLIVREPNKVIDAGPGQTVQTDQDFRIILAPGHNFVAMPFNFTVPVDKLSLKNGGVVTLRTYTGGSWITVGEAMPWEGYYFANNSLSPDELIVNPSQAPGLAPLTARQAAQSWHLQIVARCHEAQDTENFAGAAATSTDGWDANDLAEPPPIGEYVSLYFPHAEWQKVFDRYSHDLRAPANPNQRWTFVVESNIHDAMVNLQFDGLREIDGELAVYLVDNELDYKQNLRERADFEYQARGLGKPKRLSLVVGKEEYVLEETANVGSVPKEFVLERNFPNPFNPETTIRFGLPQQSVVTFKIYDLTGREVIILLDRVDLPAGRHQRVWDGRDAHRRLVSTGVYFGQLTTVAGVRTIKIAVLR